MDYDTAIQRYLKGKATQDEKDFLLSESLKALNEIIITLKAYQGIKEK